MPVAWLFPVHYNIKSTLGIVFTTSISFSLTMTYYNIELKRYFEAAESAAKEILLEEIKPKLGLGVHVGELLY